MLISHFLKRQFVSHFSLVDWSCCWMTFSLRKVFGVGGSSKKDINSSNVGSTVSRDSPLMADPMTAATAMAVSAAPYSEPSVNPPPMHLSDFEIFRTLGTGSFGRVLLVRHLATNNFYAMKKLRKSDVVRLKQVEHTNNERALLAQVNHPFVVRMMGTFQDERHLYILLDYVAGGELFSLLRRVRTLPPFVAQFYAAEVVLALEHLHSRNIIYRDLKPENLLLDEAGHIRLTDFGFAKVVPEMTWTLCGTPDYLAPEIVTSKGYGKGVDWYALGVLIYEMLLGSPPFYNENQMKLYENIVNQQPRFPAGFDQIAEDLLKRLLEKNPAKRLGTLVGGVEEIKGHGWFKDVKWEALGEGRMKAPYRPKVSGPGDASNFDQYPEEEPERNPVDPQGFEGLFPYF